MSALLAALLPGIAPVNAQEAPAAEAESQEIAEITVTARRREESLQDVPIAVSAFSAESLEQIGAVDITTLQQTTPNLTLQVARGSNSTLIAFIRGVGQQDPLWGFEPGVGLYVDDVYVARPQGAVLDIYDIERIEVLRGPQGTLYGRNTIGGAIKYVTSRIGDDPRFNAKVNLGSYSQRDVIVSGSAPVGGGFAVGGTAAIYRRDGFGTNLNTGAEHYNKDIDAFRVTAEWAPEGNDSIFFRLSGDYLDDNSDAKHGHREAIGSGLATGEPVLANIYDTRAGIGNDNSVETRGASLLGQWDINDVLTFKSITAYREGETDTLIDFDTSPAVGLDVPARYEDDQLTQELQLLFDGDRVQGVAGVFYLDASASGAFDTILGLLNLTIATSGEVSTKSWAAFTDVSFDVTDDFSVSAGGRYTSDKREGTVYRQNFTGIRSPLFGNPTAPAGLLRSNYTNERTFEEFTPRVSATYEFSDALTGYVAYAEGFKSGGFDMRGDVVLTPNTVNGYNPEFVESTEVGVKGSLADGRFTFNGAVFQADYEGQQITRQEPTVTGAIASFVDNAGSSEIKGVELEGAIRFTDGFTASYGVGYIDAEFKEFRSFSVVPNPAPPPATITVPVDLSSTAVFQNTPEWNGNLTLAYRHGLGGGRGGLVWTGSGSYRGEYSMFEFANAQLDQTESYTLVDAGVIWTSDGGQLSVGAHGRNLTDEEYKIGGYFFPGATFGNVVNSFYGPPRTWFVSASYRFD
ncbi:MAG: TonB-dependent receptor [Gammaproteobacteria bacterium]